MSEEEFWDMEYRQTAYELRLQEDKLRREREDVAKPHRRSEFNDSLCAFVLFIVSTMVFNSGWIIGSLLALTLVRVTTSNAWIVLPAVFMAGLGVWALSLFRVREL